MSEYKFKAIIIDCVKNIMGFDHCELNMKTSIVHDLKLSLLDLLELVYGLEDLCEVEEVPSAAMKKFITLGDIYEYFKQNSTITSETIHE